MIESAMEIDTLARWIICESGQRWQMALRRFAPEIVPQARRADLISVAPSDLHRWLQEADPKILFWEFNRESLLDTCDLVMLTANRSPHSLQIAAFEQLTHRQRTTVVELPVATFVEHPEDLPRLKPLVQGYFARHRQAVD